MTQVNSANIRSGANFEPLSTSLQGGIRFFTHPLPSKEFGFDYSGLTRKFDRFLDSVGLFLLYQLKFPI